MDERQIRARLSAALRSELESGNWGGGFFCRWFAQRRLAWERDDAWRSLNALYDISMSDDRRLEYLSAAELLLAAEKRLPIAASAHALIDQMKGSAPTQRSSDELHRLILNAYALKDARTYYYDTFDPGRKKSKDLELLDAFCREHGLSLQQPTAAGGRMTDEELKDWDSLVELLRTEGQENVFLPVCADPHSGAGLYLVGLSYIPWAERQRKRQPELKSCYYFFLTPSDLPDVDEDEPFGLLMEEERQEGGSISLADYDFPSTGEAESWFWGTAAASVTERLQDWNEQAPAGCPKRFLDRFYSVREPDVLPSREELARLGRQAFAAGA